MAKTRQVAVRASTYKYRNYYYKNGVKVFVQKRNCASTGSLPCPKGRPTGVRGPNCRTTGAIPCPKRPRRPRRPASLLKNIKKSKPIPRRKRKTNALTPKSSGSQAMKRKLLYKQAAILEREAAFLSDDEALPLLQQANRKLELAGRTRPI